MGFHPIYNEDSLHVLIGTVGLGQLSAGSTALHDVDFRALPGHPSGTPFTSADAGCILLLLGAGAAGSNLACKVAAYVSANAVTIDAAAGTDLVTGVANVIIFRPVKCKEASITYESTLTAKDTAGFTVELRNGALPPAAGQPFLMTSDDASVGVYQYGAFFGGELDTVKTPNQPGVTGYLESECSCVGYEAVTMRRVTQGASYTSKTMAQIAAAIVAAGLAAEYMDLDSVTGPTPTQVTISNLAYTGDALDTLVQACSTLTDIYYWKTDPYRKIVIRLQQAVAAPWHISDLDVTDGNVLVNVSSTETRDKFSNQIYVESSKGLATPVAFSVTNPLNESSDPAAAGFFDLRTLTLTGGIKPAICPKLVNDGVTMAVWVSPIDIRTGGGYTASPIPAGYDWAWVVDDDFLYTRPWTSSSGPRGVKPHKTAVITYQLAETTQTLQVYADSVQARAAVQGGSGLHETVIKIDQPIGQTELDTQALALAHRLGVMPISLETITYRGGLRAGQSQAIHLSDIHVSGTYLVVSVSLEIESGRVRWNVKQGSTIGDWKTALIEALGGKLSIGGGSSATPIPTPPDGLDFSLALYEYGKITAENVSVSSLPDGITGIDFYAVYVDELTSDVWMTCDGSVNNSSDPVIITVTKNPDQVTLDATLKFTAGQWVVFADAGKFEIGKLTAVVDNGGGSFDLTIERHYPGAPGGTSTFLAPLTTHAANTKILIAQVRRFLLNSNTAAFDGAAPPARFDMSLPSACVLAVVAAPYNAGGYGVWPVRNAATATLPGIRTCVGLTIPFQKSGALVAAGTTNLFQSIRMPFDAPVRVNSAFVDTAPTGASLLVNVRRSDDDGTTWFLVEQLTIVAGSKVNWGTGDGPEGRQAPYSGTWPFPVWHGGDLINISISQVGSTVAGSNLTVQVDM